jgi:hypothetical protein
MASPEPESSCTAPTVPTITSSDRLAIWPTGLLGRPGRTDPTRRSFVDGEWGPDSPPESTKFFKNYICLHLKCPPSLPRELLQSL